MRLREILREAARGVRTGAAGAIASAAIIAMIVVTLLVVDAGARRRAVEHALEYRAEGGATFVLEARGHIDGEICDGLAAATGVTAAGAVREDPTGIRLSTLPSATVPTFEATPGLFEVIGATGPVSSGIVLSSEVSTEQSISQGDRLATDVGYVTVAGIFDYPADGRRTGLEYSVLVPSISPAAGFDECWITSWPASTATGMLAYESLTGVDEIGEPPVFGRLNESLGSASEPRREYRERPTRWAAGAAFTAGTGVGFAIAGRRRLRFSTALHLGVRRSDLALILAVEWAAQCALVWAVASPFVVWSIRDLSCPDALPLAFGALSIVASGLAGTLGGLQLALLTASGRKMIRFYGQRT